MNSFFKEICLSLSLICSYSYGYAPEFLSHAQNKYDHSFDSQIAKEKQQIPIDYTKPIELIKALFRPSEFQVKELFDYEKRSLAFKSAASIISQATIVDTQFIDKMDILSGSEKASNNLISYLSHSYAYFDLELGKKRFVELISQPESDLTTIEKRQNYIREFVENRSLYEKCHTLIHGLKGMPESHLLSFFKEASSVDTDLFKRVYYNFPITMPLNGSSATLEVGTRLSNLGTAHAVGTIPASLLYGYSKIDTRVDAMGIGMTPRQVWYLLPAELKTFYKYYFAAILGIVYPMNALTSISSARINKNITNYMQEYLIGMSSCLAALEQIGDELHNNQAFEDSSIRNTIDSITDSKIHSPQFIELIELLRQDTFKGQASFFSLTGRVLRAYKLAYMEHVQKEMGDLLNALGEIDVYLTLATLMKESRENQNHYSFAQFVTADKPYIKATQFWNPFVGSKNAVPNTLEMGTDSLYNIILTGPNTGGKSTLLKAVMLNVLLAQTFGIAAASEFICTPFSKLSCHMNIADDTAGGVSLFKAEVLRAQELIGMVRSLRKNEHAFIIIDEIFTGTAPEKAADLSYKFMEQFCQFDNCLFINATHYKKLTDLAQETPRCSNYHMGAIVNNEGRVEKYTYTIEQGPSKINNAQQITEEEGIFH